MSALNQFLKVVPANINYDGRLVEQCEEYNSALKNLCVILPKENEINFMEYVRTEIDNGAFVINTMKSNFIAATQLLKSVLSINSFTEEFVSQFNSLTEFLDSLTNTDSSETTEPLEFTDIVNDTNEVFEQSNTEQKIEQDVIPEPVKMCSVDIGNNFSKQSVMYSTNELQSMYKLMQDIAISVGITNEDVLTNEEVKELYDIVNGYSPLIIKDAVLSMLQKSQSESERAYVTYFTTALIEILQSLLRRVN